MVAVSAGCGPQAGRESRELVKLMLWSTKLEIHGPKYITSQRIQDRGPEAGVRQACAWHGVAAVSWGTRYALVSQRVCIDRKDLQRSQACQAAKRPGGRQRSS